MLNDETNPPENDRPERLPTLIARRMVGYIRVSTTKQGHDGISLEHQRDMLVFYASQKRYVLADVYEDKQSGRKTAQQRSGLRQALEHARRDGIPLVVASLDRLARNVEVVGEVQAAGVTVHSADKGKISKAAMASIVRRAQEEWAEISRLNRVSAAGRKARGEKVGDVQNFHGKQADGAKQNVLRRDLNVREIVEFLIAHPATQELTLAQTAQVLNAAGVLNLVSLNRDERSLWTKGSLRRKLKRAKQELRIRLTEHGVPMQPGASGSGGQPPD